MNSRRTMLSSTLALLGMGASSSRAIGAAREVAAPSGVAYPRTAAESASNVVPADYQYAVGDVRRYGLAANRPDAAASNARALAALLAPTGAFAGNIWFPNNTGSDVYYFDDVIAVHDDIHIDLQGCTLEFSKAATKTDSNSGFFSVLRNFSIENGSIVVKYDMGGIASSAGSAIHIGNRGSDSAHFAPTYDSLLKSPMGNVTIRNLRIRSGVAKGIGIEMTGGLVGVIMENVWIDGQGALAGGIYYEFGWATPGQTDLRQTSHAHNMRFSNICVTDLRRDIGVAISLAGAYGCLIDGLHVSGAAAAFNGTPGESLFFQPWKGVDEAGAKHAIALRNVIAQSLTGTALTFAGAQVAANGYLGKRNLGAAAQTDLAEYSLEGFSLQGSAGGWGVYTSAGKTDIRNGRISGFQRGIVQNNDCTRLFVNAVDVVGCSQFALQLDLGNTIWSPARKKMGEIRNCFIAGNGTLGAGQYPAILLDTCAGFVIEGNRIGYEPAHDGIVESSQGHAIQVGTHTNNVICRGNYVGGVHENCVAYCALATDDARGNIIESPGGIVTTRGSWRGITLK
jgi:hypothetical protein